MIAGDSGGDLHFLHLVEQAGSESFRAAAWWQFWKKARGEPRAAQFAPDRPRSPAD